MLGGSAAGGFSSSMRGERQRLVVGPAGRAGGAIGFLDVLRELLNRLVRDGCLVGRPRRSADERTRASHAWRSPATRERASMKSVQPDRRSARTRRPAGVML